MKNGRSFTTGAYQAGLPEPGANGLKQKNPLTEIIM